MSEQIIGDDLWAEMTDGQKLDAVVNGRATFKQISAGLVDGSEVLRNACQHFLPRADEIFPAQTEAEGLNELAEILTEVARKQKAQAQLQANPKKRATPHSARQRFGLPEGFVPRLQRYGRAVLLELNAYRLPDGREFIPCRPSGTRAAKVSTKTAAVHEALVLRRFWRKVEARATRATSDDGEVNPTTTAHAGSRWSCCASGC